MSKQKHHGLMKQWYTISFWHIFLYPISLFINLLIIIRQWAYRHQLFISEPLPVPVIIVGNINIGGSGKTPFVIQLCTELKQLGFKPAVISRGYGGEYANQPNSLNSYFVTVDSDPQWVGDEPVLIAQRTNCPVWVGKNRVKTAQALLAHHLDCDILISDDGLQHYQLHRDIELVLIDGQRQFGNKLLIPAGSLRESIHRLKSVDALVINSTNQTAQQLQQFMEKLNRYSNQKPCFTMNLGQMVCYPIDNPNHKIKASELATKNNLCAFAGIGFPQRFFNQLTSLGFNLQKTIEFDDHYQYSQSDIEYLHKLNYDFITTEKDAIKLKSFTHSSQSTIWVAQVEAELSEDLQPFLKNRLTHLKKHKEFNYLWTQNY